MKIQSIYYLNLTNGIEFVNKFDNAKLIRIQSSALESSCFDKVIYELDYQFLMDLAQGHIITVVDASSKHEKSRSIWQGLPWIEYVLNRRWFNINPQKVKIYRKIKSNNVKIHFEHEYKKLSKLTKLKLDYVKNFLNPNLHRVYLKGLCFRSKDLETSYYRKFLYMEGETVGSNYSNDFGEYVLGVDQSKKDSETRFPHIQKS